LETMSQPMVHIETNNGVDAANLLTKNGYNVADVNDHQLTVAYQSKEQTGNINALLNREGLMVYSIHKVQKDLENLFLDITQNAAL